MPTTAQTEVLFDASMLDARVRALGRQITEDYRGKDLVVVAVLKGSFIFLADLVRQIDLSFTIDFLGVSSYGDLSTSSGVVRFTSDLSRPIEGKDVLLIEDIVDTGLTMQFLLENLRTRQPASLRVCTLLHKAARERVRVPLDYVGFEVEDKFLVGYGLDHAELHRHLPYIGIVIPS